MSPLCHRRAKLRVIAIVEKTTATGNMNQYSKVIVLLAKQGECSRAKPVLRLIRSGNYL